MRFLTTLCTFALAASLLLGCACFAGGPAPATPAASGAASPTLALLTTAGPGATVPARLATRLPGSPTATPVAFTTLPLGVPTTTPLALATLPARPTPTRPLASPHPLVTASPPALTQFLCCGVSAGGTYVWSVKYPAGWQVTYIPNDPRNFVGVIISDPQGTIAIGLIPSSMTPPGTALDTGNVDEFLDAYRAQRQQENPGFQEFLRQPVKGVPEGRVWAGSWGAGEVRVGGAGSSRMWASYLVVLYPLQAWAPGLPRGYLTMLGLQASSPEWGRGVAIYEAMLGTVQMRKVSDGSTVSPGAELGSQAVKPFLVRWCPKCCDWVAVTADQPGWPCPICGSETSLWETPCE